MGSRYALGGGAVKRDVGILPSVDAAGPHSPAGMPADAVADQPAPDGWSGTHWMGWRLRLLVGAALLGCLGVFVLSGRLADIPQVDAVWETDARGRLVLAESADPRLASQVGRALAGIESDTVPYTPMTGLDLWRTPRSVPQDAARLRLIGLKQRLSAAARDSGFRLIFEGGAAVQPTRLPGGLRDLGPTFWLLMGTALVLYLVSMVVLLANPAGYSLLFVLMSAAELANLCLNAIDAATSLSLTTPLPQFALPLRSGLGMVTLAALVHTASVFPTRLARAPWLALGGWLSAAVCTWIVAAAPFDHVWWIAHGGIAWLLLLAVGGLTISLGTERHPYALAMRRQLVAALILWLGLTAAMGLPSPPLVQREIAAFGTVGWNLLIAGMLISAPFLARSPQVVREFSLLAAVSTVATALDLTFAALCSMGQFTSLALSLFVSLALYSGIRQWVLDRLLGHRVLSAERLFEQLYRVARLAEIEPLRTPALLADLLRDLFDPMELQTIDHATGRTLVGHAGATLVVPLPRSIPPQPNASAVGGAIALRYAQRGRRLFSADDARLGDRVVEQIERAMAFSLAVEQGRTEERLRLAQDLHDDIGSRLLTLMYQAETPAVEEYVRHTLQDMKTLTRGLAASQHRLADAAAEWRTDLVQRTVAARIELAWSCVYDDDIALNVVQWSALTRILRELASNAIAHAAPQTITVSLQLRRSRLDLAVADDGIGDDPATWAHGLGLSGVRKRVKQLGGDVEWRRLQPRGIECRVAVTHFVAER